MVKETEINLIKNKIKKLRKEMDKEVKGMDILVKKSHTAKVQFFSTFLLGVVLSFVLNIYTNIVHDFFSGGRYYFSIISGIFGLIILLIGWVFRKLFISPIEKETKQRLISIAALESDLNKTCVELDKLRQKD